MEDEIKQQILALIPYYESEMKDKKTIFASLILEMRSATYIHNKLS